MMSFSRNPFSGPARFAAALAMACAGCHGGTIGGYSFGGPDLATEMTENACGDQDPSCATAGFGPPLGPFPLQSDPMPDPNESDQGLVRDPDGYLVLGQTHASFDFVYSANTDDWGRGTVSKINSKTVREVARYFTVTCFGNGADGGRQGCDGTRGCCSVDDDTRFTNRSNGMPPGPHQAIQQNDLSPSRTAVDWNGDVWVSNRAFGGQSSVTKIANDLGDCLDRNGEPGIQTSSDVNNDGLIDSDCNRNGVPDDVADVKGKGCVNGKPQEFYGYDDDCLLFTTNTNTPNQFGRPLSLGNGATDSGVSDAWAGGYNNGKFFRVDGITGQTKAAGQVPGQPYGAAIDANGILWAPGVGGGLFFLDTKNPATAGAARPSNPGGGYGITLDRDQNVWVGGYPTPHAMRYTPDRSNGTANLGNGFWTIVTNPGAAHGSGGCQGRGIAADSRTQQNFFVWMACHGAPYIVRVDGNIPLPVGADKTVDGSNMPAIQVGGGSICGAGVDVQQNVWAIASSPALATRILVDANGTPTQPDLGGGPGAGCPVGKGDFCGLGMAGVDPNTTGYTYSDFTGFGLRNFTTPKGEFSYIHKGCDGMDTKWLRLEWDGDVPPNTTLTARLRAGNTPTPDQSWGQFIGPFNMSPADLDGMIMPPGAKYVQVKFNLGTTDKTTTPKLKVYRIVWECSNVPG